jgi:hypothetical protein
MGTTLALFQSSGILPSFREILKIRASGKATWAAVCLSMVDVIPSGPGAFPFFKNLMIFKTSRELV